MKSFLKILGSVVSCSLNNFKSLIESKSYLLIPKFSSFHCTFAIKGFEIVGMHGRYSSYVEKV